MNQDTDSIGEEVESIRPIKDLLHEEREVLLMIAESVKELHAHPFFDLYQGPLARIERISEMHANITLAYRHLEDARMRIGKAIQAYDGGVSVYSRPAAPPPPTEQPIITEPKPEPEPKEQAEYTG